jgi:hypothetical protein
MKKPRYYISKNNEFVIENYNSAPTFSSFFPGIAGVYGCPMWVFYTNRGQAITSAGVHDKNGAIMEFQPANKAFRLVSQTGFRTFLKVDGIFYEPFGENSPGKNEMRITPHDLILTEENPKLKIRIEVNYFTVPNENFPALARVVSVKNLSRKKRNIEVIDGLPSVVPYGFADDLLKRLSRTIEAWCVAENLDNHAPYYKLKVSPSDVSETQFVEKGNFFFTLAKTGQREEPVKIIVDPKTVFGQHKSLLSPDKFLESKAFVFPKKQQAHGFTPCALAHKKLTLAKGASFTLSSVMGRADSLTHLKGIKKRVTSKNFFRQKAFENEKLIGDICQDVATESSSAAFDQYCRQTYLDNVMRGGFPVNLDGKIIYLYYRKHGDMERDYNDFKLMPTYFSQGNGNYRDINQNRRSDIFFHPEIGANNIIRFFNLIQLDGFNPLVVLGSRFTIRSADQAEKIIQKHLKAKDGALALLMTKPFLLGPFIKGIEEAGIEYKTSRESLARDILKNTKVEEDAVHGEGFWIDHFSYNTDLLESFEAIYPEKMNDLLFSQKVFTFYDNDHVVVPRGEKYCESKGEIRQYCSVKCDPQKKDLNNRTVRTHHGKGRPYRTTLIAKILCLVANKAASFDAEGIGLEMEADKPDWYDALNGLPALFGSSLSETLELKRICEYILAKVPNEVRIALPVEVKDLIERVNRELDWDKAYKIKEEYRRRTRLGLSGNESRIDGKFAKIFLRNIIKKCDRAVARCLKKYRNYYTYFINEVVDYKIQGGRIKVNKFKQNPLPLFLEGFVHALKVEKDKKVYNLVRKSDLLDKKLGMYKVNASLKDTPVEIGRTRIFTPGWLENESIWLHMEYKYILELLKAGMYDEFFSDFKKVMIPFLKPEQYKRSTLENSSFLVSSVHPNHDDHGRGFVARLSGASAEFLDMWVTMTTGKKMFSLDKNGKLCFKLSPILPAWLFNKGKFSFKLLGSIDVTYINKSKKNTYGKGVSPVSYKLIFDSQEAEIRNVYVPAPYSNLIRERKIKKIIVTLS